MHYEFKKLNDTPIPIEHVPDEHEEARDFLPSFWWCNRRYFLDDFTRCHDNPFVSGTYPDYIHAYELDNYVHPLFISTPDNSHVDIYEERCVTDCP